MSTDEGKLKKELLKKELDRFIEDIAVQVKRIEAVEDKVRRDLKRQD